MNCRRVSRLISAYIDGELTGLEMIEIRRHLDDCRACTLQYESLRYTKQLLSRLAYAEPKAGLADSICRQLDEIEVPAYQKLLNRVLAYGHEHLTPVAACCGAICALFVVLVFNSAGGPDVVAVHNNPAYAYANSISATLSPADFFSGRRSEPRPLIPASDRSMGPSSDMFTLVSLERP